MFKRIIAASALVLALHTPAYAYVLPVIDVAAIAQLAAEVALLIEQIAIMLDQLEVERDQLADMRKQGSIQGVPWNEDTQDLLDAMAEYGTDGDGLLYGGNIDQRWPDVFMEDAVWDDGGWLPAMVDRGHQTMATQQKLVHLIKMRNDAFADDHDRILQLQRAVDRAVGRNQLLKAQGALQAEMTRQHQMEQQVNMTVANMQAVSNAHQVNEQIAREAQERVFLTNFGKEPERPVFVDRGL